MSAKLLMIQGTTSNSGKSVLATALCKIFADAGFHTAPFKAWNMSLNSYVTKDGLEIGRSQGIQAEAAGIEAGGDMNPFLLKPAGKGRVQTIIRGKVTNKCPQGKFADFALQIIQESLSILIEEYDVIVMEGAGSPVELNIKENDVANMKVAQVAKAPVLIVADIDRGGAIAGIVGTIDLLEAKEKQLVIGSVLNKFRGDIDILTPGCKVIEEYTKLPVVGVIPYIHNHGVAEEDSVSLDRQPGETFSQSDTDFAVLAKQVRASLDMPYICRQMGLNDGWLKEG